MVTQIRKPNGGGWRERGWEEEQVLFLNTT